MRSLLIIPSLLFSGWHDIARRAGCHFKITIWTGLSELRIWRHLLRSLYSNSTTSRNAVQKHAVCHHRAVSICSHVCPYLSTPSVIKTTFPTVDTPDREACLLSQAFFHPHFPSFYLSTLCPASFSIHPSPWTSVLISQHPAIDVFDTAACSVSFSPPLCLSAFSLSCCLSSFLFFKLIYWLQCGPLSHSWVIIED